MSDNKSFGHTPTADDNYKEVYEFMGIDPKKVGKPAEIVNPIEELKLEDGNPKTKSKAKAQDEPASDDEILEGEDDEEIEEDPQEIEEESPEDTESEKDLEEELEEESPKTKGKDSVPLKTYLDMKSKLKEARRKNAEYEDKLLEQEDLDLQQSMIKELIDEGMDENLAKIQAKYMARAMAKGRKTSNFENTVTDELTDLAEDDYFSDALDYRIPIIKMMKEYKSKGIEISTEQAYLNVVGIAKLKLKSKTRDIKKNTAKRYEQKAKGNMQYKKVSAGDSNGPTTKYKLSSDDLKALSELQKAQPNAGWTKQKLWKMLNSNK